MALLLHVSASPREGRSRSLGMAQVFLEAYREGHPGDRIESLDLWQADLPAFNGNTLEAKYAILHGKPHTAAQEKAWQGVTRWIDPFLAADKYLFSLPMWNFGVPYRLKHYLDLIVQPGYTFSYTPEEGYVGLVTDRPVACIYARGGSFGPDSGAEGLDHQKSYMDTVLGFMGFRNILSLLVEPTLMGEPDLIEESLAAVRRQAWESGLAF